MRVSITSGNHLNQEMWAYTDTSEDSWIEGGILAGQPLPGNPFHCYSYQLFWAEYVTDANHNVISHNDYWIKNDPNNSPGTSHIYEATQSGCGCSQDFVLDGNYIGAATHPFLHGYVYDIQLGMEVSLDAWGPASNSDVFDAIAYEQPSGGSTVPFPSHYSFIDYGCGHNGNSPPYCLNGYPPQSYWLRDNKPS